MSAGFTPGPWHVETCSEGESCWCRVIGCGEIGSDSLEDCVIPSGAVSKRDAHLIAAAPEMFEAMAEFVARVEAGEVRSKRTYAKFIAILSKATPAKQKESVG